MFSSEQLAGGTYCQLTRDVTRRLCVLQLVVGLSERAGESLPFVLVAAKDDLGMSNVSCSEPVQWISTWSVCVFVASLIRGRQQTALPCTLQHVHPTSTAAVNCSSRGFDQAHSTSCIINTP